MWLEHSRDETALSPASVAPRLHLVAGYRRGVLRASTPVHALTCDTVRIEAAELLRCGDVLWLTLPGLQPLQCAVLQSKGFAAELKFLVPLHPAVYDALLGGRTGSVH